MIVKFTGSNLVPAYARLVTTHMKAPPTPKAIIEFEYLEPTWNSITVAFEPSVVAMLVKREHKAEGDSRDDGLFPAKRIREVDVVFGGLCWTLGEKELGALLFTYL